jgi:hypothetical protein
MYVVANCSQYPVACDMISMLGFLSICFAIWLCGIRALDACESGSLFLGLGMKISLGF